MVFRTYQLALSLVRVRLIFIPNSHHTYFLPLPWSRALRRVHWLASSISLHLLWLTNVFKWFLVRNRICHYYACSTLIISLCNVTVPFLPGSIPYLHFYFHIIHLYAFHFEVHPDSGCVVILKWVLAISHKNVGLTNRTISYNNQFHQVLVLHSITNINS